jgi:hypothetical protein
VIHRAVTLTLDAVIRRERRDYLAAWPRGRAVRRWLPLRESIFPPVSPMICRP